MGFRKQENGSWTQRELQAVLDRASPYVRHFLWEVSQHTSIPSSEIKSPNAAAAILKRLANNSGKEPLLLRSDHTGQPTYSLNPNYRAWITELVADADAPPDDQPPRREASVPPSPPKRSLESERLEESGRLEEDEEHEEEEVEAVERPAPRKTRSSRSSKKVSDTLSMPMGIDLNFCRDLAEFLNAPPKSTRYRIVLDEDQWMLEKA